MVLGAAITQEFTQAADKLPTFDQLPAREALPEPLVMLDGTPVKTKEDWEQKRRPELKHLFQEYMHGYAPPAPGIEAKITKTESNVFGGKATLKEVEIAFQNLADKPNAPKIHLAIFIPNQVKGPAPVTLGINPSGNQQVCDFAGITPTTSWIADGDKDKKLERGSQTNFWCVEYQINRGYAFATFHQSDLAPDKNDFTTSIHAFYPDASATPETRFATIAAWAWGFQRCIDYLVTDPQLDKSKIAIIGHSRRGKTALLAGAWDDRVAITIPHQSGTGGLALSRKNDQETVERITRVFPNWFCPNFRQFGGHEDKLPIDQHLLAALVAPRALLDTEGGQDKWANFESAHRTLQAADKVWKFLGAPGMVGNGLIEEPAKLTDPKQCGNLVQVRLDTKHTLTEEYWKAILNFADGYYQSRK